MTDTVSSSTLVYYHGSDKQHHGWAVVSKPSDEETYYLRLVDSPICVTAKCNEFTVVEKPNIPEPVEDGYYYIMAEDGEDYFEIIYRRTNEAWERREDGEWWLWETSLDNLVRAGTARPL